MSLSELRAELKTLRKSAMPTPVSRMKKTDVATEIARLKGLHSTEVKKVEEVLTKSEVPKKVAKKVAAVQEVEHKKQEEVVKTTKGVKAKKEEPKPEEPKKDATAKPSKGSEEMKERMKKLREMRKKKD
jgi:hypothetical protein